MMADADDDNRNRVEMIEKRTFQDILILWKELVLGHAILGGIVIVTLTFLVFMLTPVGAVAAIKYVVSAGFGFFIILAGLMNADFG